MRKRVAAGERGVLQGGDQDDREAEEEREEQGNRGGVEREVQSVQGSESITCCFSGCVCWKQENP